MAGGGWLFPLYLHEIYTASPRPSASGPLFRSLLPSTLGVLWKVHNSPCAVRIADNWLAGHPMKAR